MYGVVRRAIGAVGGLLILVVAATITGVVMLVYRAATHRNS